MASRKLMSLIIVLALLGTLALAEVKVDFEDLTLPDSESSWSGNYPTDGVGGTGELITFSSRGAAFNNFSDGDGEYWEGFAYSNMSDTTTAGYTNQFSAFTGTGYDAGDDIYAVGFVGFSTIPTITLGSPTDLVGGYFTNTTYAALSMLNGDAFAKKFGGATGDDPDWFRLIITGKDSNGGVTDTIEFYLADYRSADDGLDYVVDSWEYVDLSSLGVVKSLEFTVGSSDVGPWGINTPKYFAMDNLIIPEPATVLLLGLGGAILRRRRLNAGAGDMSVVHEGTRERCLV